MLGLQDVVSFHAIKVDATVIRHVMGLETVAPTLIISALFQVSFYVHFMCVCMCA